ncbi:MAG: histidine kinase [Flavobacteriaceae bacterium]|nr:histidine kinase [Flavobacteriaceae bacterium]
MSLETTKNRKFNTEQFEEILIYFTTAIHTKNSESEILWDIAKNCIAKLGFIDCVIYLVDYKNKCLEQIAAYGPKNPKDYEIYKPVSISLGEGITGNVAITGEAEIINDTTVDPRYLIDDARRFSEICVPILADNKVIGVIDCESPEKDFFTKQHLRILKAIASITGIKLYQLRFEQKVKAEQEKLLQAQKEMVDLKLKVLRSQMNPHFVFNALNAIQYFITSGNQKRALNYLSVFSKLIRFYLKHIENDTLYLTDEIEMLKRYLILQKLRYNDQVSYSFSVKENVKNKDAVIPSFVLQTLFENIIEHAIFNQYKNFSINTLVSVKTKRVKVKIDFRYDVSDEKKVKYVPEYRNQLLKWQDQIRYLKRLKKYDITKKVVFEKNEKINGGTIVIGFPIIH